MTSSGISGSSLPSEQSSEIHGSIDDDGIAVCVDCEPLSNGDDVYGDDLVGLGARCSGCGRELRDVLPLQAGVYGHESQDAYDEGFR